VGLTDALVDACTAQGVLAKVGDRPADTGSLPFVVIWEYAPVRTAQTMDLGQRETTTLVCHCAGLTEQAARIAEAKLSAAVYSLYRTTVDGRTVAYPEQLAAMPLIRDDDQSPPLYDLAVEWRLRTTPA
jgi:hypothetical protein